MQYQKILSVLNVRNKKINKLTLKQKFYEKIKFNSFNAIC